MVLTCSCCEKVCWRSGYLKDKSLLFCFVSSHVFMWEITSCLSACAGDVNPHSTNVSESIRPWCIFPTYFRSKTLSWAYHNRDVQTEGVPTLMNVWVRNMLRAWPGVSFPTQTVKKRINRVGFSCASLKNNHRKHICARLYTWFNSIKAWNENDPLLWYSFPNNTFIELLMKAEEKTLASTSSKGPQLK